MRICPDISAPASKVSTSRALDIGAPASPAGLHDRLDLPLVVNRARNWKLQLMPSRGRQNL